MVCGISMRCEIEDFEFWKQQVGISFTTDVYTDSYDGSIKGVEYPTHTTYIHRAKFESYNLTLREIHYKNDCSSERKIRYFLQIDGSIHKNSLGQNYERLSFSELKKEIVHLGIYLHLDLHNCILHNCEVGVNIELPFKVREYVYNSIILHKTKEFEQYAEDRNGLRLGRQCTHSQYVVKVYDKGLQYNLSKNIMRFELRFVKMEVLHKYGIFALSDLIDFRKVNNLLSLLLKAWQDILIYEPPTNNNKFSMTADEQALLYNGNNPKYWINLQKKDRNLFNRQRVKFKSLMNRNSLNTQSYILKTIRAEWEILTATKYLRQDLLTTEQIDS
jgi:hypothetical protein